MRIPQSLPTPLAFVPFTFQEAVDAGVSHRRLRHPSLRSPSRGIRIPDPALAVVADHLLRIPRPEFEGRTEPCATREKLADMLDRHKGTPGIRTARLALEQARIGADSAPETRLRLALENAGLPEPQLNAVTELGAGVVRQPDLSYPEYRVAVEYDGETHSEAAQIIRDIPREEDFSRAGWHLVRISKRHMTNDARSAVAKVRAPLLDRGWIPK